jgi:uncharacterized membrane protein YphA (DoxX/SURF4 family)
MWILNIILAIIFLGAGAMHAFQSPEKLISSGLGWVADTPTAAVKTIGWLEIIGAFGLILPIATGIATFLAPTAAACLAIVMLLAVIMHARRKESVTVELILCVLAIATAIVGFLAI